MHNNWRLLFLPMALAAIAENSVAQALSENEAKMFSAGTGYERFMGRWSRLLAPELVAFAGVKDGQRVLDVGTGTGALASALVKSGPGVQVVGIDPSAGFIAYAQKEAGPRARFEVGDAQALKFADGSFDAAMALLVMNFIPDAGKAALEMRRVTRPGGTVSACVWDYDAGMQMLRYFWDEVVALDPAMAPKDERHMKLCRERQLGELWRQAGLADVREQSLTIEQAFASFHDYWEPFLKGAGPGGAYVVSLAEEPRQQLEARLRARLLGGRQDRPFTLQARAWCVRGDART
jgi:ubiquinone/menaquinone biosynthesis C-methylase UbiE